jgi:hypothetical protein
LVMHRMTMRIRIRMRIKTNTVRLSASHSLL